ncbi:gamma-aminobutyric acid type B receptor subunit 1-like [Littorina saxatilis]|uniref:gamma-aminobutyric acid type B receptor subunit 1-like n=1 Tax=Littorina saxatilis TaxID=31220 RepID=UPI0038B507B9
MTSLAHFLCFLLVISFRFSIVTKANNATPANGSDGVKDLYLMGLFPFSGPWFGGESLLASTRIAINQVNEMNALPGYRLQLVHNDTKCDPGHGVKALFEQLYAPPTKLMIIGAGCSIVSEATARASHLWNLVQISYASVSPSLSEKTNFPKFARVAAPDTVTNPARVRFFKNLGWSRIATIHQSYELFSKTIDDLVVKLKEEGLTVIRSEIFREDPALQVRNLLDHDCRIIVGSFYEDKAKKVLCEAYKIGLYGRRIVWILNGWYDAGWWKTEDPTIDCTPQQLEMVVEGYFDAGIVYLNPSPDPSVSGWRPSDFMREYNNAVKNQTLFGDIMTSQGYDAVWAITLALNNTRQRLIEMGSSKGLEDFSYTDADMADLLYSSLLNVSFMGVRGPIGFDSNGDPVGLVKLDRVQGGASPRDATVTRTVYVTLSVALYASMSVLAGLGILLACGFLTFNIVLRKVKMVKMSSPRLNNVILFGCIAAYCSVFVQDAGGTHGTVGCEVKTALLVVGISFAFGALFAKTWRVHVIFTNTKLKRKILSDVHLFGMMGILVLINMIVLITWWILDPREITVTSVKSSLEGDAAGEVLVKRTELSCVSEYELYFLGTLYGIQSLVLLFGTFLAFETRNVHYPELNDSKFIGMCIYNVALLSIPAVVVGMALDPGVDLKYALSSGLVLLGTTVTQCLIFVPKVASYRHHKVHGIGDDITTMRDNVTLRGEGPSTVSSLALPPIVPNRAAT